MESEFKIVIREVKRRYDDLKTKYFKNNRKYTYIIQKLSNSASENEHLNKRMNISGFIRRYY